MNSRIDYASVAPGALEAMRALEQYVRTCGIEPKLLELMKIRASQINGCAYCLDMHTKDTRAQGETEQRIYALDAWRETPFFTERERAALAWTESVTQVSTSHVPDEVYGRMRELFDEREIVNITAAIVAEAGYSERARTIAATESTHLKVNPLSQRESSRA